MVNLPLNFIGFDDIFDSLKFKGSMSNVNNYPPHDIVFDGEHRYTIVFAVAGFGENDIEVHRDNNGYLTVKTVESLNTDHYPENSRYLHRGISRKHFKKAFKLRDHIVVEDASFKNGLLTINLKDVSSENYEVKKIEIKSY